jgi:hypothetical protein
MTDSFELKEILDGLKSDGELDSEGDFTLNSSAAREKLGQSMQSMPERAIYYFIQAGVACQAISIRLTVPRHNIRVQIRLPESDQTFRDPAHLVNPPSGAHPALQCISMGMLWFSTWPTAYSMLEYVTAEGGYRIRGESEGFEELEPFQGPKELRFQLSVRDHQAVGPASTFLRLVTGLQQGLNESFRYSPVPITMDARQVLSGEDLRPSLNQTLFRGYIMVRHLVLCSQTDRGCLAATPPTQWPAQKILVAGKAWPNTPELEVPLGRLELAGDLTEADAGATSYLLEIGPMTPPLGLAYDPYLSHQTQPVRCRALFYRVRKPGSTLIIVHHGLRLKPLELEDLAKEGSGWTIVVATRQVNTDFLGTQVIQDHKFKAILDWAYSKLASIYQS